ncbi:MAG: rhamnose/proton symporter RhaT [Acidobacteria bacterium]|nr:rhamnose/proton symporter RhaT [Acidobacteriota bacterium]
MNDSYLPFVLVLMASFFQGTFGLGMKKTSPLAWEVWWFLYAAVGMVAVPCIWASLVVPSLGTAITTAGATPVALAAFFGFLWGVGGILFGLSVSYVGISLTYGIVMGLAGSVGSLVPLVQGGGLGGPAAPYVLAGVGVMIAGVAVVAWAGMQRDRVVEVQGVTRGRQFRLGMLIAVLSGVLSALLNVGFANAAPVARAAEMGGANARNASLAAWVVVLGGAFVMNASYCLMLLIRGRKLRVPRAEGSAAVAAGWAVLTGVLWFAALGVYGQGASLMGSLGPVIGWPMLLGLALIISNLWAIHAGEWMGAPGPMRLMFAGVAILIVACALLGYSNGLQGS